MFRSYSTEVASREPHRLIREAPSSCPQQPAPSKEMRLDRCDSRRHMTRTARHAAEQLGADHVMAGDVIEGLPYGLTLR